MGQGDGSFVLFENPLKEGFTDSMHGWEKGWFSVPYSIDCVAAAPPCIDHYNRNTGVYQVLDPPKHPEGLCPRGAALWVQLCQIMWAKEPAPAKTKEPSPCLPPNTPRACPRGVVLWIQLCRIRRDKEPSPVPNF